MTVASPSLLLNGLCLSMIAINVNHMPSRRLSFQRFADGAHHKADNKLFRYHLTAVSPNSPLNSWKRDCQTAASHSRIIAVAEMLCIARPFNMRCTTNLRSKSISRVQANLHGVWRSEPSRQKRAVVALCYQTPVDSR